MFPGCFQGINTPTERNLQKPYVGNWAFFDIQGIKHHSGCLKALRELEAAGHLILPSGRVQTRKLTPQRLHAPVPLSVEVPHQIDQVRGLELVLVYGA